MQLEVPPLCERGRHMMMRLKDKSWHCYTCDSLDKVGKLLSTCLTHGHLKLKNAKCAQCETRRNRPDLVELYQTGQATCRKGGHHLTVESITWTRMAKCKACAAASGQHSRELRRIADGQPADPKDVDWVRVLQYVSAMGTARTRTLGDNYELVPYSHLGNGERWVVACTARVVDNSADARLLKDWRELGVTNGWKHTTLFDILSSLHLEEYSEGRLLELSPSTG